MALPRPIHTIYEDGSVGRSTTKQRAVQQAARRLLSGDHWHAYVYEHSNKRVAELVCVDGKTITIHLSRRYWK